MKADCVDYLRARNVELSTLVSWIRESEAHGRAIEELLNRCGGGAHLFLPPPGSPPTPRFK